VSSTSLLCRIYCK